MARFSNARVAEAVQPFWAALQAGEFIADAAVQAGTYRKQGTRWVAACGGVRPRRGRGLKGRCLSFAEREARARARPWRDDARARPLTERAWPRRIVGQRVDGHVQLRDQPATGSGRAFLIEPAVESNAALKAIIADYLRSAKKLGYVPMFSPGW